MLKLPTKLRFRRILRRRQRQVEGMGTVADDQLEQHFFRRLGRLVDVRRFVIGWVVLVTLLAVGLLLQANALRNQYQSLQPTPGGIFTEGIIGTYSNSNPLYATGAADGAVSRLIFAGLLRYDKDGKLASNLAEKFEIDPSEKKYTVTLKSNLVWHDGHKLTAEDVVFTYSLIQNPDVRSYLQASWRGIVVKAVDERTIEFTLQGALSSFPHSLTNGLVPKHILQSVNPEQLRSNDFNTIRPIGAGPFRFETVEVDRTRGEKQNASVGLSAFESFTSGAPNINRYVIRTFSDQKDLEQAYADKEVTAISGLSTTPDTLPGGDQTREISLPVSGQVMVFFKTTTAPLNEPLVRKALVLGSNRHQVIADVGYPLLPSDSPLLRSQLGYDKKLIQKTGDVKTAKKLLDQAGWKTDPSTGIRKKGKRTLSFRLYSEANSEYTSVTQTLQKQWREIGVDVQVALQSAQDLQSTVATHNYDALLYAISTGADPDVYAYWHSSQADVRSATRLNFSEYKSHQVNNALEAGRSRTDAAIRSVKYKPFLQYWTADNPALALYQPRYLFIVREPFYNFETGALVTPADRYSHVERWMIRQIRR